MDNKKKLEIVMIPVLIAVFVTILGSSLKKIGLFGPKPAAYVPSAKAPSSAGVARLSFGAAAHEAAKKRADHAELGWGRDPFVLREATPQEASSIQSLSLMGVTWSSARKAFSAIINDEIVSSGSTVGKFKVIAIDKDRVIVTDGKENYELKIKKEF